MNAKNQFKVLWVYQSVKVSDSNRVKVESGQIPSLCFKGRKHMFCVSAGHPVRVLKRDAKDFDRLREVAYAKGTYPVERAIAQFRTIANRCGITAGAEAILERAENSALDTSELEESLTNEEEAMNETNPVTPATSDESVSTNKETNVKKPSKKTTAKAKAAPKAAKKPKAAKAPKAPKGPSRISKAVEYMKEEVKKAGGQSKLERGWRKELFERAGKKFDLSPTTCAIQYSKQVLK